MQDIQVDSDGAFRCWNCGGKHFSEKRTRRAKVIGVGAGIATVGLAGAAAPLIAKKRLYCQSCSEYNKMGNAQPFKPKPKRSGKQVAEPSEASTALGVILILAIVVGLTAWAVNSQAWWWLIILVPALIFVFVGAIAIVFDSGKPKAKKGTTRPAVGTDVVADEPRSAGWYPDTFQAGRERWWSGTAWTNQTRWPS